MVCGCPAANFHPGTMRVKRVWFGCRPLAVMAAAIASLLSATALACPRCATGQVARALAFGPVFWPNLLAISSPFILLAALSVACARIGARREGGR
jgi:hypothetical protein